jgi:predicted ATPase
VGKTTIITLLRQRGFAVVDEVATQIINEGKILPWVERDRFQKEVLRRQLEAEDLAYEAQSVKGQAPIFLDRGPYDGEAYYISDRMAVPDIFDGLPKDRYELALLIEPLPFFDNNGVRFEDLEYTRALTPIIEDCYARRDIKVAHVPALPPEQRVDHVLQLVAGCGRWADLACLDHAPKAVPVAGFGHNLAFAT